jgi:hypothetical protein
MGTLGSQLTLLVTQPDQLGLDLFLTWHLRTHGRYLEHSLKFMKSVRVNHHLFGQLSMFNLVKRWAQEATRVFVVL